MLRFQRLKEVSGNCMRNWWGAHAVLCGAVVLYGAVVLCGAVVMLRSGA